MSNAFAVTTPYVEGAGADYFETHGALEFSPHSAIDPNAPAIPGFPPVHLLQRRRQTFDALPQWKGAPRTRSLRPSTADNTGNGPNGNFLARSGTRASKHRSQPSNPIVGLDYDEMLGVRDDSDAEARMQRLLNQLESVTQPASRAIHEGDSAFSSSSSFGQGVSPYKNAQSPSTLTRGALARRLDDSTASRDPVPMYATERVPPRDAGVIDHYTEPESRLPTSGLTSQFPKAPQNITRRPPLPRHKSAPPTPNTTHVAPLPARGPLRSATFSVDGSHLPANHAPGRKPTLVRGRHGGSEQNLRDFSRQNSHTAQPGHVYGHSNSSGNLFLNPPVTPASPSLALPALISDSMSRSSSFTSIQTRLVTPTDLTAPPLPGAPHPLGRIDEKPSLDYNEIQAAKARRMILSRTPSHTSSGAREKEKEEEEKERIMMGKRPGLKLVTPLPSAGWQLPPPAEFSSGKRLRSVATTPATSVFDMGSIAGGSSIGGPGGSTVPSTVPSTMPSMGMGMGMGMGGGGLQRSYSRSAWSEISTFSDTPSRTTNTGYSMMTENMTPAVVAATSFALSGTMPTGVALSKAEKAAERARQKAESAAKKAERARFKVELEREAKAAAAEGKRLAAEAKKRGKEERQRQADMNITRLVLYST
jgi:hypothetical protein